MKKGISIALSLIFLITLVTGCKKTETLKLGLGVYSKVTKATDAEGDTNGIGEANITVAALLLDEMGRIVSCAVDSVAPTVEYTSSGKVVSGGEIKSKYELGSAYKMSESSYDANGDGVVKEWYEQADIFTQKVKGKTIDEVKKMVATGDRGDEELQKAGCTIVVSEFVMALENAAAKTTDTVVNKNSELKINTAAKREESDAKDGVKGVISVKADFRAFLKQGDDNMLPEISEAAEVKFEFDQKGIAQK